MEQVWSTLSVLLDLFFAESWTLTNSEWFDHLRIGPLLFADDVVLLVSSSGDFQLSPDWFTAKCEAVGMRISTSKSETMVLSQKRVECSLRFGTDVLPQVEESKYLRVSLTSEGKNGARDGQALSAVM